jgi:hypothetical protein
MQALRGCGGGRVALRGHLVLRVMASEAGQDGFEQRECVNDAV